MRRDRVAKDIYVLISERYIQVTSTVLLTEEAAVVIDATPFPAEAREVQAFIASELGPDKVRYVVNTHHHADHIYGTCVFDGAEVISQDRCRQVLEEYGQASLRRAQRETPELAEVELCLADMTFDEEMDLYVGEQQLYFFRTPGHTEDSISVYVEGEKALVAGDAVMPVPYIVNGDRDQLRKTLQKIKEMEPDFVIQGHGSVLLRGEVDETIDSSIEYLSIIEEKVWRLVDRGESPQQLREIDIESCGMSRIPLDGMVSKLHLDNLIALYREFTPS